MEKVFILNFVICDMYRYSNLSHSVFVEAREVLVKSGSSLNY